MRGIMIIGEIEGVLILVVIKKRMTDLAGGHLTDVSLVEREPMPGVIRNGIIDNNKRGLILIGPGNSRRGLIMTGETELIMIEGKY